MVRLFPYLYDNSHASPAHKAGPKIKIQNTGQESRSRGRFFFEFELTPVLGLTKYVSRCLSIYGNTVSYAGDVGIVQFRSEVFESGQNHETRFPLGTLTRGAWTTLRGSISP